MQTPDTSGQFSISQGQPSMVDKLSSQTVTVPALLIYLAAALFVGGGTGSFLSSASEVRLAAVERDHQTLKTDIEDLKSKHSTLSSKQQDLFVVLVRMEGEQKLTNHKLDQILRSGSPSRAGGGGSSPLPHSP
jgi:hypothetical protein